MSRGTEPTWRQKLAGACLRVGWARGFDLIMASQLRRDADDVLKAFPLSCGSSCLVHRYNTELEERHAELKMRVMDLEKQLRDR